MLGSPFRLIYATFFSLYIYKLSYVKNKSQLHCLLNLLLALSQSELLSHLDSCITSIISLTVLTILPRSVSLYLLVLDCRFLDVKDFVLFISVTSAQYSAWPVVNMCINI